MSYMIFSIRKQKILTLIGHAVVLAIRKSIHFFWYPSHNT